MKFSNSQAFGVARELPTVPEGRFFRRGISFPHRIQPPIRARPARRLGKKGRHGRAGGKKTVPGKSVPADRPAARPSPSESSAAAPANSRKKMQQRACCRGGPAHTRPPVQRGNSILLGRSGDGPNPAPPGGPSGSGNWFGKKCTRRPEMQPKPGFVWFFPGGQDDPPGAGGQLIFPWSRARPGWTRGGGGRRLQGFRTRPAAAWRSLQGQPTPPTAFACGEATADGGLRRGGAFVFWGGGGGLVTGFPPRLRIP